MSEEKKGEEKELEYSGALIKVQSQIPEEYLFKKMYHQVQEDYRVIEEILKELGAEEIRSQPLEISTLVHYLLKNYTGTLLGQIVHPIYGKPIIVDRIKQIAEILLLITERRLKKLLEKIEKKQFAPDEDIAKEIDTIIRIHTISMIALRECMNRLLGLLHINAPPTQRPPLANIKIGYEIG